MKNVLLRSSSKDQNLGRKVCVTEEDPFGVKIPMRGYWRRRSKISTAIRSNLSEGSWWKWKKRRRVGANPLLMRLRQQKVVPATFLSPHHWTTRRQRAWGRKKKLSWPSECEEGDNVTSNMKTGWDNWVKPRLQLDLTTSLVWGHSTRICLPALIMRCATQWGYSREQKWQNSCFCGGVHFLVGKIDNKQINKESLPPVGCCCTETVEPSHLLTMNL